MQPWLQVLLSKWFVGSSNAQFQKSPDSNCRKIQRSDSSSNYDSNRNFRDSIPIPAQKSLILIPAYPPKWSKKRDVLDPKFLIAIPLPQQEFPDSNSDSNSMESFWDPFRSGIEFHWQAQSSTLPLLYDVKTKSTVFSSSFSCGIGGKGAFFAH